MDQLFLDKANKCLEILGVSGIINVHLDNDSPVCLSFCQKVKIYFDISKPSHIQSPALQAALGYSVPHSSVSRPEKQPDVTDEYVVSNSEHGPHRPNDFKAPSLVLDLEKHCVLTVKEEKVDLDYETHKGDEEYKISELGQSGPVVKQMQLKQHHNPYKFSHENIEQSSQIAQHQQISKSSNKRNNARAHKRLQVYKPDKVTNEEEDKLEKKDSSSRVMQSRQKQWPVDQVKIPAAHSATNHSEVLKVLKKEYLSPQGETSHEPEYLCLFCNTPFLTNFHLSAHHRLVECIKQCQKCSEEFASEADLFIHEHAEHSHDFVVSRYPSSDVLELSQCAKNQCPMCGQILSNESRLHHHVQHIHFQEKTFSCCVCGHREKGYCDLLIHLRRHSNNRILAAEQSRKRRLSHKRAKADAKRAKLQFKAKTSASQESPKSPLKQAIVMGEEVACPSKHTLIKENTNKPCDFCGRRFKNLVDKKGHTYIPVEETKCSKCNLSFSSQAELIVHEYRDHSVADEELAKDLSKKHDQENKPLTYCPICLKQSQKASVVEHVSEIHTKEMRYQCCVCSDKFTCRRLLLKHCRSHMNPEKFRKGLIRCSLCPEVFTNRGDHSKHFVKTHSTVCVFCQKDVGHKLLLQIHYKEEHEDRMLTCDICGKQLPSETRLITHKKWHKFRKSHPCPVCGKLIRNVQAHIERFHPDYEKEKCDTTGDSHLIMPETDKRQKSLSSDNSPDRLASNNQDIYLCSLCPTTFSRKIELQRHLRKHEITGERVPCPQCKKTYGNRELLARHLEAIHIRSKIYTCHVCGKQCNKKSNLNVHMRTHMLNKVFSCKICSQGFNYRASLKSHLRSKHNAELTDIQ